MPDDSETDNNGRSSANQPLLQTTSHTRNSSSNYSLRGGAATTTGRDANAEESKSFWKRTTETASRALGLSSRNTEAESATETPIASNYLTLVPLSDARLQPRNTRRMAFGFLLVALVVAGAVYMAVPRSISLGNISIEADKLAWNESKAFYELRLLSTIPLNNPNFFPVDVEGHLEILFYDAEAGSKKIKTHRIPSRSNPFNLQVQVDASGVPKDYILSIVSQCSTFPHVLTFFLQGKVSVRHFLLPRQDSLPSIDTYFMIDCYSTLF